MYSKYWYTSLAWEATGFGRGGRGGIGVGSAPRVVARFSSLCLLWVRALEGGSVFAGTPRMGGTLRLWFLLGPGLRSMLSMARSRCHVLVLGWGLPSGVSKEMQVGGSGVRGRAGVGLSIWFVLHRIACLVRGRPGEVMVAGIGVGGLLLAL